MTERLGLQLHAWSSVLSLACARASLADNASGGFLTTPLVDVRAEHLSTAKAKSATQEAYAPPVGGGAQMQSQESKNNLRATHFKIGDTVPRFETTNGTLDGLPCAFYLLLLPWWR